MTERNDELMARALLGELSSEDEVAWNQLLTDQPALAREFESLGGMVQSVAALPDVAFSAGFSQRVVAAVGNEVPAPEPTNSKVGVLSFDDALRRQFRWMAPVAAAAALVLLAINVSVFQQDEQSPWEAAIGLDPVTVEAVYQVGDDVL